ncbi:MAG: hypothetical protein HY508_15710 [Acidobacteria bacterium]|nr:hypothetical protein [Acidobacteriota bacterium]
MKGNRAIDWALVFSVLLALGVSTQTLVAGQARSGKSGNIAGVWESKTEQGGSTLLLNADGSGEVNGKELHWTYNQGILSLSLEGGSTIMYEAVLAGNSLSVKSADMTQPKVFTRLGSAAAEPAKPASGGGVGGGGVPASRGGFGGGGVSGGEEGGEEGDDAGSFGGNAGGSRGGAGGGLTGNWRNQQGSTLQLNPDGTAMLNGQRFRYTTDGSTLTLIAQDGSIPFPYSLSGNTLTVQIQGQTVIYTRTGGAGGAGGRAGGSPGGGTIPQDMIGKWCYINVSDTGQVSSSSSTCFVLNPDGTYEYSGESSNSNVYGGTASQSYDRGTWRVNGSTVNVNSQQQGPVTYQLQKRNHPKTNDPMLCLDGQCYVTYGPKPPWPY